MKKFQVVWATFGKMFQEMLYQLDNKMDMCFDDLKMAVYRKIHPDAPDAEECKSKNYRNCGY